MSDEIRQPEIFDFAYPRGDKRTIIMYCKDDRTGRNYSWGAKRSINDDIILIKKTDITAEYISAIGSTKFTFIINPDDTDDLESGVYVHDLQSVSLTDLNDVTTEVKGEMSLDADVQRPSDNIETPETVPERFIVMRVNSMVHNGILQWDEETQTANSVTPGQLVDENFYNKTEIDGKVTTLEQADSTLQDNIDDVAEDLSENYHDKTAIAEIVDQVTEDMVGALADKADLVDGKVPSTQLPSYVDDVVEYANFAALPATGETGKIYVTLDDNLTYRWGGSEYVEISKSLALGETASTAYRGNRGKTAYDHSQTTGNPHGTSKDNVGLGNVPNLDTTDAVNNQHTHSNKELLDTYTQTEEDIASAITNSPTSDEKAALAGSYGTPSANNKYVTQTDPLLQYATINDIGIMGEIGAGVGIAPPHLLPAYIVGRTDYGNKGNDNYGNYVCVVDGSVMPWIPKYFFKVTHLNIANMTGDGSNVTLEFTEEHNYKVVGEKTFIEFATGFALPKGQYTITEIVDTTHIKIASSFNTGTYNANSAYVNNSVQIRGITFYDSEEAALEDGFVIERCFIDGGVIKEGVFVDKYKWSLTNFVEGVSGVASSIPLSNPISSSSASKRIVNGTQDNYAGSFSNCISNGQAPTDTYDGAWAAAKSRGDDFATCSGFIFTALARLATAHGQAATSTVACAWYHATNNFPKGNNNRGSDFNDSTCTFAVCDDAYWATLNEARKNGSGNIFAKTTHNGQNCGVADINGNQWEITQGLTSIATTISISLYTSTDGGTKVQITTPSAHGLSVGNQFGIDGATGSTGMNGKIYTVTDVVDATNIKVASTETSFAVPRGTLYKGTFYTLKESIALKNVTGGNSIAATDHFADAFITTNMDVIAVPFVNGIFTQRFGNSSNQVLPFNTSRSHADYKLSALGLPKNTSAISTSGTNQFGQDYYYQYFRDELCSIRSGSWLYTTYAGLWSLSLGSIRASSSGYASARACLYV